MIDLVYIVLFAAAAFLYYGISCLLSPHLIKEFKRFGIPEYRILTGVLQLSGATGLVLGLFYPWLGFTAAAGLAILMLAGFITRIKIKDTFLQSLPSFFFMLLNAYIASSYWNLVAVIGE
jgi:hypothetical protein